MILELISIMISVKNLSYTYPPNKLPTLKGLNFELRKGEILGFLGPSGAGKSSTQKILIKLIGGFSGEINVMERPLSKWDSKYYEHIGVGFELPHHYLKLTALENLKLFAFFYEKPTRSPHELLEMVGLLDAANKRVEHFSKGMKMRLNFVRALLHDPQILFLDEPTAGLDPMNARVMKDIILDLKAKGTSILLTTHNMQDADELCDRVAFIVDGCIVKIDSPRQMKLLGSSRKVKVEYVLDGLQSEEFSLDHLASNSAFLTLLEKYPLQAIHSQEASLEDVFIQLTGRGLG